MTGRNPSYAAPSSAGKPSVTDPWPEWQVQMLRRLVEQGLPASRIGEQIGRSRNAVIGKIDRLGLRRGKPTRPPCPLPDPALAGRELPQTPPTPPPDPDPPPPPQPGGQLTIMELAPGLCRYIVQHGAGLETLYCGDPCAHEATSYCGPHHALCNLPNPRHVARQ